MDKKNDALNADEKLDGFRKYLESGILRCREDERKLVADSRKDEANIVKVKANIYQIFETMFELCRNNNKESIEHDDLAGFNTDFAIKLTKIPENWRSSYENAKMHEDAEKILIEETKLAVLDEIKKVFENLSSNKKDS